MFRSLSKFTATVWLVIIATMASRFTFFMIWPFMAVILHANHGLNPAEIGVFLTIPSLIGNTIGFYIGYLSDLFGRRKVILGALALSVAALVALGLTANLWVTLGAMIQQAIARSGIEPTGKALITDELEDREVKDLALHARYYTLNIGTSFGPLVGVAWGLTGQQTTFLLVAATVGLYLIAAVIVFSRESDNSTHRESSGFSFRAVLRTLAGDYSFMVFVLAMLLGLIAYSQMLSGMVQYLQVALHPDVVKFFSLVTLTNGLTVLVLQFPLLALTKRFDPMTRSMIGVGLMAVSFVMLAVFPVTSDLALLAAIFVLSVGEVILFPTLQILIDRMAPEGMKGSYFGAAALSGFGFALGPVVAGALLEFGGGAALWWSMAALSALVAVLYRIAGRLGRMNSGVGAR